MTVTLTIEGPPRILIINPKPNDTVANTFLNQFTNKLQDASKLIVGQISTHSFDDFYNQMQEAPKKFDYNTLMFITHGNEKGDPVIEDKELAKVDPHLVWTLNNWIRWADMFQNSFKDRLIVLALCYGGSTRNAESILRRGLGMHLLTSREGESLAVNPGAESMADFFNYLSSLAALNLPPRLLEMAYEDVEKKHPQILDLWLYPGENPYRLP